MSTTIQASLLTFPDKLWYLVNDAKCEEIQWNQQGTSIVIPNNQAFTAKILNNCNKIMFKTHNFSSFVRQLNLYGFRKVTEHCSKRGQDTRVMASKSEFRHQYFRKSRRDLLAGVKRQIHVTKKEKEPHTVEAKPTSSSQPVPYHPIPFTAPASPNPWTNWDSYLQAMGLFPYLPPHTIFPPIAAGDQLRACVPPGPILFGRDIPCTGMPFNSPFGISLPPGPQMFPVPQGCYDDIRASGVEPPSNGECKGINISQSSEVTNPKPAVVIINNTLSTSRDVTNTNGYHGNSDVIQPTQCTQCGEVEVGVSRSRVENKKPFPAQNAKGGGSAPQDSRRPAWCEVFVEKAAELNERSNLNQETEANGESTEVKRSSDLLDRTLEEAKHCDQLSRNKKVKLEINGE